MEPFAFAMIRSGTLTEEARSALPGAPVVPHVEPVRRAGRARAGFAAVLRRLAEAVAPEPNRVLTGEAQ